MLEDLEQETTQSTSSETENLEGSTPGTDKTQTPEQVLDLDQVPKFRMDGREWTPKDFKGAYMMQADYSRKTQALAEERKYYDNLSVDLEHVKKNPVLAAQFRAMYPEKFHGYLKYITSTAPSENTGNDGQKKLGNVSPEFEERFSRVENAFKEQKQQAIEAEIDSRFKVLQEKYPMADEPAIISKALAAMDQGHKPSEKLFEELFKADHERHNKRYEQVYSQKVKAQKQANLKAKDAAPGGGTPGQAPKTPRTIKEATAFALQELENS